MNRDEFIALLARGVREGWLTEDHAVDLLRRYDEGALDVPAAPLPAAEAIRGMDRRVDGMVVLRAAGEQLLQIIQDAGISGSFTTGATQVGGVDVLRIIGQMQRIDIVDQVQTAFEDDARSLAFQLANGELSLPDWQRAFSNRIRQHQSAQSIAGTGRLDMPPKRWMRLDELAKTQEAYLSRFADQIALAQAEGRSFSPGYLANRAQRYAGLGRAEHFRAIEESFREAGRFGAGWVVKYQPEGDANTCAECAGAEGYYLVEDGPMPDRKSTRLNSSHT